jgi:hypothetical protein
MVDVFLQLARGKTSIHSFGFCIICILDACARLHLNACLALPWHAIINYQSIDEPLNESKSLPTGFFWLHERQNRFIHNFH